MHIVYKRCGDYILSFTIVSLFLSCRPHTHTLVEASCKTTKCLSPPILHTLCGAVLCLCIFSIIKPPQLESYLSVICALTSKQEQTHEVKPKEYTVHQLFTYSLWCKAERGSSWFNSFLISKLLAVGYVPFHHTDTVLVRFEPLPQSVTITWTRHFREQFEQSVKYTWKLPGWSECDVGLRYVQEASMNKCWNTPNYVHDLNLLMQNLFQDIITATCWG